MQVAVAAALTRYSRRENTWKKELSRKVPGDEGVWGTVLYKEPKGIGLGD